MTLAEPQQDQAAGEKRAEPRDRVLMAARLAYGGYAFTPECVVRNMTGKGAAVRVPEGLQLPPTVALIESSTGRGHEARVVWQRDGQAGLAITSTRNLSTSGPADPLRNLWLNALPRGR